MLSGYEPGSVYEDKTDKIIHIYFCPASKELPLIVPREVRLWMWIFTLNIDSPETV